MSEAIRSWLCLNTRCAAQFTAWEPNPACSQCGCVRVQWIPGGGHVAGTAKAADAELRALADCFRMEDINSARRDERAKPHLPQSATTPQGPSMAFSGGFSTPVMLDNRGKPVATCLPSSTPVNYKAKVTTGSALAHSRSIPGIHTATAVEATHRPPR